MHLKDSFHSYKLNLLDAFWYLRDFFRHYLTVLFMSGVLDLQEIKTAHFIAS